MQAGEYAASDSDLVPTELLQGNTPLSFETETLLRSKYECPQGEFQQLAPHPYSHDISPTALPTNFQDLFTTINAQSAALSIRNLPDEVLQQVFLFSCFDSEGMHGEQTLRYLCSVDHHWRETVISHCHLWTSLPPMHFDDRNPETVPRVISGVKLYLCRSGSLPISFEFEASKHPYPVGRDFTQIQSALTLLLEQGSRWGRVILKLPGFGIKQLVETIKGPFPSLASLDILIPEFPHIVASPQGSGSLLDVFCDAPNLRELSYRSSHFWKTDIVEGLAKLPLSQLEVFKSISQDDRRAYCDILESPSPNLRSIECASKDFVVLPRSTSIFLPHLTILKLHAYEFLCDIASHIETLTLPSLKHLEVKSNTPERVLGDQMYTAIQTLVRQSSCSLESLCFSSELSNSLALTNILSQSPELVELDFLFPDAECISAMVYDPSSPSPIAPKLKTLIFRSQSTWHWYNNPLQSAALNKMLMSRSTSLRSDAKRKDTDGMLQEVTFLYVSELTLLYNLSPTVGDVCFDGEDMAKQAWKDTDAWARYMIMTPYHSLGDWFNPKLMLTFQRLMRNLESLGLKGGDLGTHKLMAYGIPSFLHALGLMKTGSVPGDRLFHFRYRAKKLLKRWKPFLLRDARRYRWCHYARGTACLKWGTSADDGGK
ncbi:hypothetical protein DFP72DRAFT_916413 [Ephemerocybe angulata]|uniref:F-box domain-containing protein n=1 Tax=Ephemerocybe angulata TaxID=980116 RepID=A0A8H6HLF8_9AGAR|nr:hypothetical protein DFP72DRAFT_916413 [Tulosesus angulatus]